MPIFSSGPNRAPTWCELEQFEIVRLSPGETHRFDRLGAKEKLIVGEGRCRLAAEGETVDAEQGTNLDLTSADGRFEVVEVSEPVVLVRMCGRWGEDTGGSGLFSVERSDNPEDGGDPADYAKQTNFDSHFHDCDEYWILYEGAGVAVSEGKRYEIGPGDCVATGMGHHHDFPQVTQPVRAVYFETTMEGAGRRGHLWDHTHGPAAPQSERV